MFIEKSRLALLPLFFIISVQVSPIHWISISVASSRSNPVLCIVIAVGDDRLGAQTPNKGKCTYNKDLRVEIVPTQQNHFPEELFSEEVIYLGRA